MKNLIFIRANHSLLTGSLTPSFLPSLPTCVMYSIGCLYLSGYSIVSLQCSPVVSLAAPPLTCTSASSAAQCRFWLHVGCCVLLRGVSFWSLVPVWLLCSEGPFRLRVHQHGMISPLSCVPCRWPTLPNFTSLSSPSFLSVAGLGAPLSSSLLKRMNE